MSKTVYAFEFKNDRDKDEFKEMIEKTKKSSEFKEFFNMLKEKLKTSYEISEKEFNSIEFIPIKYYARTGPSWMCGEQFDISQDFNITFIDILAYAFHKRWRKCEIICKNYKACLYFDSDRLFIVKTDLKWTDPYSLTVC